MSKFNRDEFEYSGGYLMYEGDCGRFNEYYGEDAHPTRVGKRRSMFVARFKYSGRDKARFLTFLINNFTVEEYFAARAADFSPAPILEARGYVSATVRKGMKDRGYTSFSRSDWRTYFAAEVSTSGDCSEFFATKDAEFAAINAACAA